NCLSIVITRSVSSGGHYGVACHIKPRTYKHSSRKSFAPRDVHKVWSAYYASSCYPSLECVNPGLSHSQVAIVNSRSRWILKRRNEVTVCVTQSRQQPRAANIEYPGFIDLRTCGRTAAHANNPSILHYHRSLKLWLRANAIYQGCISQDDVLSGCFDLGSL